MKRVLVIIWLVVLLFGICSLFWYNQIVYSLPTPVPANYKVVPKGELINFNTTLGVYGKKPLFLHFFNPDCPCSRFNISNFKSLVKQYNNRINFVVVVMSSRAYTAKDIQAKFDLNIPVCFDKSIAAACGVYSTPQAVLIDGQTRLYYRGNYNKARYCTDDKTSFAKMAIEGLLNNNDKLVFSQLALKSYGCKLPGCKQ